ncbi:hypothetical protein [Pedobacter sp. NJ-S-72]
MSGIRALLTLFILLTVFETEAQVKTEMTAAKKAFEGTWYNKKENRYLNISFDYDDYALINDWVGRSKKSANIDAYKAFPRGGKLILPEEKEHHGAYCEMLISRKRLLYKCKGLFLKTDQFTDSGYYVKIKIK